MSSVFSKNKGKRSRSSSGESNNSFVKNVTSRVSGLLPATITKWFSSPRSSANGSAGGTDATDSSTEDEGPDSPVQPPNKRMRREERSFGSADASCVTNNIETIESSTQYTVQSPPGRTTFRRETNFVSTPIRPDETTDRSTDRTDKDTTATFTPNTTAASIGLSASRKRKSLFGDKTQELSDATQKAYAKTSSNTLRDPRQPTFKPTLLGSPFYAGKTTYGGAASSYINQPNISQRQNTTVKEAPSTSDNNMSTSARRILELLESYSSPLMDAKRIPHYTRPTRQEVLKRHSESSTSHSLLSPYNKTNSYRTQELHVPSIASILRLKRRSRLNDSTNAARQLVASHSSSSPDYLTYSTAAKNRDQSEVDGNSKFTTKVKTKRTRIHGIEADALDTHTITPVELPKAVLQIDPNNLPNFSIPVASKSSSIEKPTPTTPFATSTFASKTASVEKSKSETTTSNSIYNFANPVRITSESPKPTSTPPKFTFGSPERSIDKPLVSEKTSEPSIILGASKESEKTEAAAADWNCPDCWVKNKSDAASCVCCGHKPQAAAAATPALPAKCSLCKLANSQPNSDKCVNCAKVQVNNITKPLKADTTAKWSCKDCWASNDDASDKCACCGAANPKKQSTQTVPAVEKSGGMCSKCFSTKNSNGTCSKCEESKPDNTFKIVLKSQANKWECEHCLVRNDSDKTKCVCCEAERSGAPKQPEKKQFNFGTVNTTFKFGIDPKAQEANLAKMSEKPEETKDKVEESETNNNVLAKAPPTFFFGIPDKKSEDQPYAPKAAEKSAETPKATFTFGVPKQNSLAPTSTPAPLFGIPNKLTEASKESEKKDKSEEKEKLIMNDKPEEVKKAVEPAKPPVMMFGSAPLADKSTTNQLLSTAFTLKKDASSASLSLATTSTPAPILTFSASTTGSAEKTGLFGATATTTPATTISFAPTTTATATSALSMFQKTDEKPVNTIFQKSEPPTTTPTSLFPKSDAPAASAAAPVSTTAPAPTAAPMFSFGSSQAQSGDKPSFNFTFGNSNKSDVFKPPTFAAKDSSTTVNQFSLGGSTTENPLAPNPLAGGNGLSATNSLTSNSLGGNSLSVNPLAVGLSPGNGLSAAAPSIFGSAIQKETSWTPPNNSTANPFNANATTNSAPKPFSFGSSTPFSGTPAPAFGTNNTQTSTPAFGSNLTTSPPAFGSATQPAAAPAFGASQTAATPAFGSNVQSTPNIFGMPSQNSQPSIFSTPNQNSTGMFGSPTQPAQAPALGMFGRPNVGATPTFGTPNPSIPTFEAPSAPSPAPSFNFGTSQTSSFMFGQQPQQQAQPPQTGVYNFGGAGGQTAQVQFSMGSAPSAGVRRVRRAVRRSSQR
ncbi:nuclear pore complex protein Nup153-like [Cydia pomonella]|uniref:nuclear pore complex protein Nup153-like n=1 Tax=Cydia pomonella TaxID=82600 RepID=UPI002ADD6C20|nr:nuclear pore complex protein Nup153-like [Cydia pomonella]